MKNLDVSSTVRRREVGSTEQVNRTESDMLEEEYERSKMIEQRTTQRQAEIKYLKKIFIALAITCVILLILDFLCIYVFNL